MYCLNQIAYYIHYGIPIPGKMEFTEDGVKSFTSTELNL